MNIFFDMRDAFRFWRVWATLAKFDIIKKYKRSLLGPWWITLSTLVLILSISLIYSVLLKVDISAYIINLSLNLIIWFLIRDSIIESCNSLIEARSFILNEKFNIIILSLRVIIRNFIIFLHNILIYIVIIFYFSLDVNYFHLLISIFSLIFALVFLLPICISLSLICTRFRDIQMIINNIMQFLFFISPILFSKQILLKFEWIILVNPIALLLLTISEPVNLGITHFLYYQILFFYFLIISLMFFLIYRKFNSKITYWL